MVQGWPARIWNLYWFTQHRHRVRCIFDDGRQMFVRQSQFRKEDAVSFIKQVLCKREKIGIILDKAPQHASNDVTDLLQEYKGSLRLRYLPTGVPELNAIEGCWNRFKGEPFMYKYYSSINDRMDAVMEFLRVTRFNFDIQKFLFKNPIAIT